MSVVIDTSTVAPHERWELWSAATSALFFPSELRSIDDTPISGVMAQYELGPVNVFRVRGTALVLDRTAHGVVASDPEFFALSMLRRGRLRAIQDERASHVGPGVMSAYDSSRPFRLGADTAFDQVVVTIPKPLLRPYTDAIARRTALAVPLDTGVGRMTAAVFNQVLTELETGRIRGDDIELAEGLVALVRGLYAGTTDREPRNGTQSVHMRAIKTYIEAHLADRDLGPDAIARSQFISTRYLHKLFEREGITVSGWIRSRRLDRARRDLQDPALAREPIQAIATRWGFGSASHFSHAVRAAYGCSPSELRAAGPSAGDQLA